ncbi:MAG: hypothetical protein IJ628_06560 [Bacteroidaceae bacterium]|nr:hypothetical protein [Bacteroidaceae bacterium]
MMICKDRKWNVYSTILLIQAFHSLKVWFFWWLPDTAASVLFAVISILYLQVHQFWNFKDIRRKRIAIILLLLFLYSAEGNINAYIYSLFSAISLLPLVFLKLRYLIDLLERFQIVITAILAVSLLFWIGHLVGYDLPSFSITYGQIDRGMGLETQYYFSNHIFYLVNQSWMFTTGLVPEFMRFCSVFLEPGYLAILMVFLLFVNRFDFKDRRNILYIIVIVSTVSLAGFLMSVFAYIAHSVQHSRQGIYGLAFVGILLFFSLDFFKEYNHGDNFINQGIINRLEYDDTTGTIAGNNRTSVLLDDHFDKFVKTKDIWFGLGRKTELEFGVGYKKYLMKYGIFGLTMWLTFMLMMARIGWNYRALMLFVLYVLMFIRGDGSMFWLGFILVYIGGVVQSKYILNETLGKK